MEATGTNIGIGDLQGLIKEFAKLRQDKEKVAEQAKAIESQITGLKGKITQVLLENNQSSFRVDGTGLVSVVAHERIPTPKGSAENRALYEYVLEHHGKDACDTMFKMHDKTLTSFFKAERAVLPADDQELFRLPGCGEPTVHHDISFRVDKE